MPLTLVLGGARSGKSAYAENVAVLSQKPVVYMATAKIQDEAIQARVKLHQVRRPESWITVESPLQLAQALQQQDAPAVTILVDCLTMWVTNLLCEEDSQLLESEIQAFLSVLSTLEGEIILVSNEVGMGIIPMGKLTRDYVDLAGKLHQQVAAQADNVVLVTAGLPLAFKGSVKS